MRIKNQQHLERIQTLDGGKAYVYFEMHVRIRMKFRYSICDIFEYMPVLQTDCTGTTMLCERLQIGTVNR